MLVLNNNEIMAVSGASRSAYSYFDVKFNEVSIDNLPIIFQLTQACISNKCEVTDFVKELINAGIDLSTVTISSDIEFNNSFYEYY